MKPSSYSYDMTTAKFHRTAVQVTEAQSRIAAHVSAGRIEQVPLPTHMVERLHHR